MEVEQKYIEIGSTLFEKTLRQFCSLPYEPEFALEKIKLLWWSQRDLGLLSKPSDGVSISREEWQSLQVLGGNFLRFFERMAWEKFVSCYDRLVRPEHVGFDALAEKPITAAEMRSFRQKLGQIEKEDSEVFEALSPFFDPMVSKVTKELQSYYELHPDHDGAIEISWSPILQESIRQYLSQNPQFHSLILTGTITSLLLYLSLPDSEKKNLQENVRTLVDHVVEFVSSNLETRLRNLGYKANANGLTILLSC